MRYASALTLALVLLAPPVHAQEPEGEAVFVVVERMPEVVGGLESIRPTYPEMERRAGVEGRVFVQFVVNEDGSTSDFVVVRGVSPALDAAAVDALREARFRPGIQEGRPVKVQVMVPINFQLVGGPPSWQTYLFPALVTAAVIAVVVLLTSD